MRVVKGHGSCRPRRESRHSKPSKVKCNCTRTTMCCRMGELRERLRDRFRNRFRLMGKLLFLAYQFFSSVCLENAYQAQDEHLMVVRILLRPGTLQISWAKLRHVESRPPVSGRACSLACHPERSAGSRSPTQRSCAALRMIGLLSTCLGQTQFRRDLPHFFVLERN